MSSKRNQVIIAIASTAGSFLTAIGAIYLMKLRQNVAATFVFAVAVGLMYMGVRFFKKVRYFRRTRFQQSASEMELQNVRENEADNDRLNEEDHEALVDELAEEQENEALNVEQRIEDANMPQNIELHAPIIEDMFHGQPIEELEHGILHRAGRSL